jgi:cytochrome b6-f complex iron-sulfur subunit
VDDDDARWARLTERPAATVPGVPRRRFVRGAGLVTAGAAVGATAFAAFGRDRGRAGASRPPAADGLVELGPLGDVLASIDGSGDPASDGPRYLDEHAVYVVRYPFESVEQAVAVYDDRLHDGLRLGLAVLSDRCTHLHCAVPWCASSQWFECPCHGAKFDAVGERRGGPAPRGLDHFRVVLGGDDVVRFDPAVVIPGVPPGTATTDGTEPAGPFCV